MTVHEIAALAGVSIGTVDRVIHKRGRVSAATQASIEAIIEKYGFSPNPIASRLKRNKDYRFCALLPRHDQDAGYWQHIIKGIENAANEIKLLGVDTSIAEFDRYDFADFQRVSCEICKKHPDGILFAPVMPKRTRPFIEAITQKNIPFVFVDSDMPDTSPLCVIGQDPFKGGYLAGRLFHLFCGDTMGPIGILNTHGGDYNIACRQEGFLHYALSHNFDAIIKNYTHFSEDDVSPKIIADFLQEQPGLSGLFVANSMIYRASLAAAHRRAQAKRFLLVGYDLIPENAQLLRQGKIDALISQRPEEQGREALLALFQSVALGQTVQARRDIPLDVYIKENVPD